jgi:hypothetical protein
MTVHPTQRGQASVETVALLPVLLVAMLVCWQAVLAGWTAVSAAYAARAAARAELVGDPPSPAAAAAVPHSMRAGMRVSETGGRVTVTVRVPAVIPGVQLALSADADVVRQ